MLYNNLINYFFHTIFPEKCSFCQKGLVNIYEPLCADCLANVSLTQHKERCLVCYGVLIDNICNKCLSLHTFFKNAYSIWSYKKENKKILKMAKFSNNHYATHFIKKQLLKSFPKVYNLESSVILPMPSSKKLVFHCSKSLNKVFSIPIEKLFYKKNKNLQNKEAHEKKRFLQIQQSLAIKDLPSGFINQYQQFIILDDVWTTGATTNFAAQLLQNKGVSQDKIFIFTLFRKDLSYTGHTQ